MWRLPYLLIRLYQRTLSPLLGSACRYHPSCSEYAAVALQRQGLLAGGWLALRRILRCHPWHEGGFDPVPSRRGSSRQAEVNWGEQSHG